MRYPETPAWGFQFFGTSTLQSHTQHHHHRSQHAVIALGLLGVILLTARLWWPGVHGPFLFDDIPNFENLKELECRFDRTSLGVYLAGFTGTPGRPLSALSFLLNDCAWPSDAYGFKVVNLLLHLLNGLLVFGLARTLARIFDAPRPEWISLLTATAWLLSPIQVSPVFLTVQRMTLLSATFTFAGLWWYAVLVTRANNTPRALIAICVLGLSTLLAFLCKENGALMPLLAWVLHATLMRDALKHLPTVSRRLLWLAPVAAMLGLVLVLASQWGGVANFSGRPFTQYERVLTEGRVLMDYLSLIFAPQLSSSGLYNDDYLISRGLLDPATTLLSWCLIVIFLLAGLALRKRAPVFSFAVLWFLAGHALESSVLSLELYFEHRNYVPLFAIAFAVSVAVLRAKGKLSKPARIGFALWLLLAAAVGHLQAGVWGNWAQLSTIWRAENPDSQRAQQQYADFLFRTGQHEAARKVFEEALARGVRPLDTRMQLIHLDCMAGRDIAPQRIRDIEPGLRSDKLHYGSSALLIALRESLKAGECGSALDTDTWLHLTRLALDNPSGSGLQRTLRMERAYLYLDTGNIDAALPELQAAWEIGHEPRIAFYTAAILASNGRLHEAREWALRPQKAPGSRFKDWLSQTQRQSRILVETIDEDIAARSAGKSAPNRIIIKHH